MKMKCETGLMNSNLHCFLENSDLVCSIRRVDDKSDNSFCKFHNEEILPSDIATYIPNWQTLDWKNLQGSLILDAVKSESVAKDIEFKIHVMCKKTGNKNHDEVIQEFKDFMNN